MNHAGTASERPTAPSPDSELQQRLDQLELLHALTETVGQARSLDEIFAAALDGLLAILPADRASILLFDPDGVMRFKAWRSLSDEYRRAVEGHSPWQWGEEGAEPIQVDDVDAEASLQPFRDVIAQEGIRAFAFIPLLRAGKVVGKFMLYCDSPYCFGPEELQLARAIARTTSFAVERQRAEEGLRGSEARWRLLAESGAVLASSLELADTLSAIAHLAVPALADLCLIHLCDDAGSLRQVAAAHIDPSQERALEELGGRHLPSDNPRSRLMSVLESGEPALVEELDLEHLEEMLEDGELMDLVHEIQPRSAVAVPLSARGRSVGTLSLIYTLSERRFDRDDLPFVKELGRRAGLAVDNAQLYGQLRDDDRRKDEFLAMLAHELRNPLAAVVNAVELLRLRPEDARVRTMATDMVHRQTHHMARLIDDLLDVSRITRGRIPLRKDAVELVSLVRHAVDGYRPRLERQEQQLSLDLSSHPVWLQGDAARLEQVVGNLLDNATKFTARGGAVAVTVEEAGDDAVIRIADSGAGIGGDFLPHVFDIFAQEDRSLARTQGGLGIGLTLARSLVELHGGRVEATSAGLGKGSTFEVRLQRAPAPQAESEPSVASGQEAHKVMVVEDEPDTARALSEILRLWDCEVLTVPDGPAALAAAGRFGPDVVLLDIGLPGMDGYELARELRALPETSATRIIALTGYGQPADRRRSAAAGIDQHLVKPVEPSVLKEALAKGP
ncbi:MAG TPA: GAF domain-containing protein [Thermoanaerobaculia bacterium]|nr:GAF domain-containing protein [Thermoanaerobaculia bacterium]